MAIVNVTIRMDENVKKEAEKLFDSLGLDLTTAINNFLMQAIKEQRIPYETTMNPSSFRYATEEEVEETFEKEFSKHERVYKELAK